MKTKLIIILLSLGLFPSCTENYYKNYIIKHKSELKKEDRYYRIDSINSSYFTDVTVRLDGDSAFTVVFWGDRNSWKWNFLLDKHFSVDIPYNRYKGKNITTDLLLLQALNECK